MSRFVGLHEREAAAMGLVVIGCWLVAGQRLAATDTQTGTPGTNGTNGAAGNPGVNGGTGGDGQDVTATATTTDASNTATATGGNGGIGGNGGAGNVADANGGAGGRWWRRRRRDRDRRLDSSGRDCHGQRHLDGRQRRCGRAAGPPGCGRHGGCRKRPAVPGGNATSTATATAAAHSTATSTASATGGNGGTRARCGRRRRQRRHGHSNGLVDVGRWHRDGDRECDGRQRRRGEFWRGRAAKVPLQH